MEKSKMYKKEMFSWLIFFPAKKKGKKDMPLSIESV